MVMLAGWFGVVLMLLGFLVVAKTVVLLAAPSAYKNASQTKCSLTVLAGCPLHAAAQHG